MEKQYLLETLRGKLISANVRPKDVLVVAVSGGADSMALLDLLYQVSSQDMWQPVVVHINHGLRKSAIKDQKVVEDYCREKDIEYVVKHAKLAGTKTGIEEKARLARYKLLREIKETKKAKWIVTAHNSGDQVETIVLNFLRGSGVRGMGGMKFMTKDVLRPMLTISKIQLLTYAKREKVKFAVDETNADVEFMRNRIRHQLLPVLKKYNPAFEELILQNSAIFQQSDLLVRQLASHALSLIGANKNGKVSISISRLRELMPIVQMEVVRLAIEKLQDNVQGIKKIHIDAVFSLIAHEKTLVSKKLPGKLLVEKAYDTITIVKENNKK
jgi:tRNA(Ile)-lysidine synthase